MQFSPQGSVPAISVASKGVSLIRTRDGETTATRNVTPFSLRYSRDGTRIFLMSESKRELLEADLKTPVRFDSKLEPGYVGMNMQTRNGKLLVNQLFPGGPLDRSGRIKVGDELLAVGEGKTGTMRRVIGFSDRRAQEVIRGAAGTYIQFEFIPKGQLSPATVTVRREAMRQVNGQPEFIPFVSADVNENLVWCISKGLHQLSSAYSGEIVSVLQTEEVNNVGQYALSPDSKVFAVLATRCEGHGEGSAIELFSVASRERLACIAFPKQSWFQMTFSSDGSRLLVGTWDTVEVLDVNARRLLRPLTLSREGPTSTDTVQPRRKVQADSADIVGESMLRAASEVLSTGRASEVPEHHSPRLLVACLACSSNNIVVIGDHDGKVSLWDLSSRKVVADMPCTEKKKVERIEFSPDGKWLAYYVAGVLHVVELPRSISERPSK